VPIIEDRKHSLCAQMGHAAAGFKSLNSKNKSSEVVDYGSMVISTTCRRKE